MFYTIAMMLALAPQPKAHRLPAITIAARVQCSAAETRFDIRDPFNGRKLFYCYSK